MQNCFDKCEKKKCCGVSKVVIPAALGDENGQYKPENGAYFNTLVEYQASGVSYMYTNDGIPTRMGDGIVATIEVGKTTTLQPGEDATVENVGDKYHAVLNFGIPEGQKGDTGDAATVNVGATTTGAPGSDATVTNSGDEHNAILNFTIPRGPQGEQGVPGQAATIAVGTVTTLDPDQPATVTNSGTSSAAVFDFGIPKGDKGDTGVVSSEVVEELPIPGDDSKFYLVEKNPERNTESGEYISFETTQTAAAIQSAQIDGNATQTTYSGKNLWNGAEPLAVTGYGTYALTKPLPAGTYTLSASSITTTGTGAYSLVLFLDSANQTVASDSVIYSTKQRSFTLTSEATQVRIYSQSGYQQSQGVTTTFTNLQIESGSTATSYEPYVGGIPAPNPQFPMPISVVTGENTVKIDASDDSQEFLIDLGSIELAKIGTYQDRIYTDGTDWFIEKKVGKVVLGGSESWGGFTQNSAGLWACSTPLAVDVVQGAHVALANYFTYKWSFNSNTPCFYVYNQSGHGNIEIIQADYSTLDTFRTWLSTHPTTVYYVLATPTTTEITNQTLIDQLEALASAPLNQGVNNIFTEIATGNAMPTLELNWAEWERYNRYSVYIWNDGIEDYQILNS